MAQSNETLKEVGIQMAEGIEKFMDETGDFDQQIDVEGSDLSEDEDFV